MDFEKILSSPFIFKWALFLKQPTVKAHLISYFVDGIYVVFPFSNCLFFSSKGSMSCSRLNRMAVAVVHLFYYVNTQGYLSASGMRKMRQAVIITHPDILTPATIRKQERVTHPEETNGYELGT